MKKRDHIASARAIVRKRKRAQNKFPSNSLSFPALLPELSPFPLPSPSDSTSPSAPVPQKRWRDLVTYAESGACLRCGRVQKKEQRRVVVIFDAAGEEVGAGLSMCASCAGVVRACLERGTRLVPIVLPDSSELGKRENFGKL